jgi:hypothetical protein
MIDKALTIGAALFIVFTPVPSSAKPLTITNATLGYSVVVPSECRTEEGPGTLEAICAPDMDEAKSADLPVATALLLEVDAEPVTSIAEATYGDTEFRRDVPVAVCGDGDSFKVKISDLKTTREGGTAVLSATITCPEIKFLGLAERQGQVRSVITPKFRYRLLARSLLSDAAAVKPAIDSFFQSFKPTQGK